MYQEILKMEELPGNRQFSLLKLNIPNFFHVVSNVYKAAKVVKNAHFQTKNEEILWRLF